ncbi:aldehyde dehydrogenase family protein [Burkholderia sp. WSM2232]|uniref:aldehyde dehydrogenase family protein n=1 Tax=Burkholderia sp. WSM2232 TaxID=944436 RepID=UPI00041AE538|nr:aldehyde dehydrogenase family protein [Burkholderia sp. WSM2232]
MRINRQYIAGEWRESVSVHEQAEVFSRQPFSVTHLSAPDDVETALAAARNAAEKMESVPAHRRARWLREAADALVARIDEFAAMLVAESGKPLMLCHSEIGRSAETLRFSADEATRIAGSVLPMDASERGEGRLGFYVRVPVGVVSAITPFNAPLNLLAHKIGPALAAGNAVIAKPDPRAASCATRLVELFAELGLPPGAINLVHGGRDVGERLTVDDRVDLISFTGSKQAAFNIVRQAGLKRVQFELGGNAGNIVCEDADLDVAASELAIHAFGHAGQSCIGVQRIHVHQAVHAQFMEKFLEHVRALKVGDPALPDTQVGPLIDAATAERLEGWIRQAVDAGAALLTGGVRDGAMLTPTVLVDVDKRLPVVCEEVFGPIVTVERVTDLEAAIESLNDSIYGLQAGVFTKSVSTALECVRRLKVGGVVVNGTSNYRVDHQPYGGVKKSGIGREGPAFAIEAMTELRMAVMQ